MRDTTPHMPPATPAEAEELAKRAVAEYLNACRMTEQDQIGNYLMKLCSVAGVLMANAEGADDAFARLLGTAQFVLSTMPKKPATLRPMQ
jgi:predicted RNase H-like HicB family nuclease